MTRSITACSCGKASRRVFLSDCGMGFVGLVLGSLLQRDGFAATTGSEWSPPDGKPHFPPKAKSVIWIFLQGGLSHLESFDPKPAVNKYAGKSISETPHKDVLNAPFTKKNVVQFTATERQLMLTLLPLQVGYRKRGRVESRSATGGRISASAWMMCRSCAPSGRPITTTPHNCSSTRVVISSKASILRSGRGSTTAWEA